jgi:hypothetical protein
MSVYKSIMQGLDEASNTKKERLMHERQKLQLNRWSLFPVRTSSKSESKLA